MLKIIYFFNISSFNLKKMNKKFNYYNKWEKPSNKWIK